MIRLTFLVLLFLLAILVLFKAYTYHLWLVSILVTEFPLIFAGLSLILGVSAVWAKNHNVFGAILGLVSCILFLVPVVSAVKISKTMDAELEAAFGVSPQLSKKPFEVLGMLASVNNRKTGFKEFTYRTYSEGSLKLDFYPAQAKGKRPCVIVIHGGSWKSGDNKQLPELNYFLASSGYHVAAINYRLAPKYQNPCPVEDIKAALEFSRTHADELEVDTSNIVLLGRSAGAQIALLSAYTLNSPRVKGVVDFYGPADMVWGYAAPARRLVMDSRKVMEDYLGGTYDSVPENYLASSPIHYVNAQSVPTLLIHGENDVLVSYEHSIRLQRKLNKFGVKNYLLSLPWATHAFDYSLNGPNGQLSTYAILKFLNSVTNKD